MKSLWNMLNKEFTIEGAVSAFLVINMIGWMAATIDRKSTRLNSSHT